VDLPSVDFTAQHQGASTDWRVMIWPLHTRDISMHGGQAGKQRRKSRWCGNGGDDGGGIECILISKSYNKHFQNSHCSIQYDQLSAKLV
jgi:hypothetical protein